jgi:exopolyphosphatase/guanosine-5'-triphosphate,3'-diphosphate pyrophosphatase
MSGTLRGALDVGSNSVKLLVGRVGVDGRVEVAVERVVVTRLSEGVDHAGTLSSEAVVRTLAVLETYAGLCRAQGLTLPDDVAGIGTAVLRDARDREAFCAQARALGFEVEVIDGDTEAALVRLAALRELPGTPDDAVVIDIGGGSSELAWDGGRESTELGVVRLTERHVHQEPAGAHALEVLRGAARERLARIALPRAEVLIGSSATCACVAQLHQGLGRADATLHGHEVPAPWLSDLADRLSGLDLEARRALPGMDVSRADVLLAGVVVLEQAALALGADRLRVNERGTRYGVFHRAFGLGASGS